MPVSGILFQITKLYYGRPVDGDMKKGGNFYENGSRGFQIHLCKLMGREFRFDGNVQEGSYLNTEYLRFDIPSSGQRYEIYRNKKWEKFSKAVYNREIPNIITLSTPI